MLEAYDTMKELQSDRELMEMEKMSKKPDIEWFFDTPYSAYCGECKRMICTGGVAPINLLVCPWCDTPINWSGWQKKEEKNG